MLPVLMHCKRCQKDWKRRTVGALPKECPFCKRLDWNLDFVKTRHKRVKRDIAEGFMPDEPESPMLEKFPFLADSHGEDCECTDCLLERGVLG